MEIPAALQSSDSQDRLRGVTAVRKGYSAVSLPMLLRKVDDREFVVWRQTETTDSMAALLKMIQFDRTIGMCDPKPLTLCQC
ncbi:hypothetical protein [Microcoleus sp. B4-C1]|uniref:hypothetical protein n=1 Tax=Microcoleus sp. B4-C1 TaxID=2818660 RepID=UPI002FD4A288